MPFTTLSSRPFPGEQAPPGESNRSPPLGLTWLIRCHSPRSGENPLLRRGSQGRKVIFGQPAAAVSAAATGWPFLFRFVTAVADNSVEYEFRQRRVRSMEGSRSNVLGHKLACSPVAGLVSFCYLCFFSSSSLGFRCPKWRNARETVDAEVRFRRRANVVHSQQFFPTVRDRQICTSSWCCCCCC